MKVLEVKVIKVEDLRNEPIRDYNPAEWDKVINRYLSYGKPIFYKAVKNNLYGYDRYFVKYSIDDNIMLRSLDYNSSLSANGFCRLIEGYKLEVDENGVDVWDFDTIVFFKSLFNGHYMANTKENLNKLKGKSIILSSEF